MKIIDTTEQKQIAEALSALMGVNGDKYIDEILETGELKELSYQSICSNIYYNGRASIVRYMGLVYYYYLARIKRLNAAV